MIKENSPLFPESFPMDGIYEVSDGGEVEGEVDECVGELTQGVREDKNKHRWVFSEQRGALCEVADIFEEIEGEEMVKAGAEVQECTWGAAQVVLVGI